MNYFDVLFGMKLEAKKHPAVIKKRTGNPIEFSDGADAPLVKCVSAITGSQDLHGYDKPWVGGAGNNKLPLVLADIKTLNTSGTWSGDAYTISGVTFTILTDSNGNVTGVSVNGTATENITFLLTDTNGSWMTGGMTYKINGSVGGSYNTWSIWVQGHGSHQSEMSLDGDGTFTYTAGGSTSVRISVDSGVSLSNQLFRPMIRLSTVTDSTFTPYSNICPIVAYTEGEIEVCGNNAVVETITANISSSGELVTATGFEMIIAKVEQGKTYIASVGGSALISGGLIGGYYKSKPTIGSVSYDGTRFVTGGNPFVSPIDGYVALRVADTSDFIHSQVEKGNTVTAFEPFGVTHTTTYPSAIYRGSEDVVNGTATTEWGMIASYAGETLPGEWISDRDEYAPGTTPTTGAQVAYELATPTTSSVTPTKLPIKSLSGYNHIESSTGEMEIEYIAENYQEFVDVIEETFGNRTRKGGRKAIDVFRLLDPEREPEPKKEDESEKEPEKELKK